jgi:hypothetical protein
LGGVGFDDAGYVENRNRNVEPIAENRIVHNVSSGAFVISAPFSRAKPSRGPAGFFRWRSDNLSNVGFAGHNRLRSVVSACPKKCQYLIHAPQQ